MAIIEKKLVRYPLYILFFFFVFGIATALSFPDTQIKEIATVQIQKVVGPKFKVKIDDVDLWRFVGLELQGLSIKERIDEDDLPEEGAPVIPPMQAFFPSVGVRLAPIKSILNLGLAVKGQVDVEGGDIEVYFTKKLKGSVVEIELDDLDLAKTKPLSSFLGVPFFGTLDGGGEIVLNDKGLPIDGQIVLRGTKVTIGPAVVKTDKIPPITYLEVPQSNFGGVNLEFDIESVSKRKSIIKFKRVGISGRDIRGETWGYINLGGNMGASVADLKMRMQLDDKFVKKNKLSSFLNVAQFRNGKNKGWYGFKISGRLKKIKFKGNPAAGKGALADPIKAPKPSKKTTKRKK